MTTRRKKTVYRAKDSLSYHTGQVINLGDGVYKVAYSPRYPDMFIYVWYTKKQFGKNYLRIKKVEVKDIP